MRRIIAQTTILRVVFSFFVGLAFAASLQAHDVIWYGNPTGTVTNNSLVMYYAPFGQSPYGYITVAPEYGEPCTVQVHISPTSDLINAQIISDNPANVVTIQVEVLRPPNGSQETAVVNGYWGATGFPPNNNCNDFGPNNFSVPIVVTKSVPKFSINYQQAYKWVDLNLGYVGVLQRSSCLTGPYINIGMGQMFSVTPHGMGGFFQRAQRIGGYQGGTVTDPSNNVIPNVQITYPNGGPSVNTDSNGIYAFARLIYGINMLSLIHTNGASLNVGVTNTGSNVTANFKAAFAVPAVITNACNCTPWCAIGFASLPGGQTPVYYAGGANPPKSGPADCGTVTVTVTPPNAPAFAIRPGTNREQNSGDNPASGTWTVTTTVCGQSKSASVQVP
jgi:hypothetical protein